MCHVRTTFNLKNIMWSKMKASYKTRLAHLDKKGDMLNEDKLIKSKLIEERSLLEE